MYTRKKMKGKRMTNTKAKYISVELASIFFIVAWLLFSNSEFNGSTINGINGNILFYLVSILLFAVLLFIFYLLISKTKLNFVDSKVVSKSLPIINALLIGGILIWNYFNEDKVFPKGTSDVYIRHRLNPILVILLYVIAVVFFE